MMNLEDCYILGYWFAEKRNRDCWYLIMTKKDSKWVGQQSFSYSKADDDPFAGTDKKSVYELKLREDMPQDEEHIIKTCNEIFEHVKMEYRGYNDHFLVKGTAEDFLNIGKTKPYLNFKKQKES